MSGFVHLHCHSVWSLLDGTIPAESLAYAARYLGFEAIALTDHDSLTGAVRFARACRDAGSQADLSGPSSLSTNGDHVTAIAKDAKGYANLCRLISDSHLSNERGKPGTTFEKIADRAEGLFVLSGCKSGEVARLAAAGAMPKAEAAALRWREAIGDDYRLEVFDHRGYGDRLLRDRLLGIAKDTGIPAVATNDVHYLGPRGRRCARAPPRDQRDRSAIEDTSSAQHVRVLPEGRARHGRAVLRLPGCGRRDVADRRAVRFRSRPRQLPLPRDAVAERRQPDRRTGPPVLRGGRAALPHDHTRGRRTTPARASDDQPRVGSAGPQSKQGGFAGFFVLVAEIVRHIKKDMGIRCSCRGSAAGSLVCFVLEISDVDPIRYDLLFERFMNERREEIPDIDMDVESHRREEILRYIGDTYGAEQTAMCCMVDTFRARGAIREVGKAIGMPLEEIDVVAKAFPRIAARDIPAAIERLPELAGTNLRAGQLEQLFHLCQEIDGFPRHLALHPSGMILSSPDLMDRVPMQESFQGFPMLQADKDDVEELGLAKLDVLGVRMLSSISHATEEIGRVTGEEVDLDSLAHNDEKAFELIRSSKTLGCFQIESPGQRELLARFQPNRFEDLIIDISLFRPGPVKSDMIKPFLNRTARLRRVELLTRVTPPDPGRDERRRRVSRAGHPGHSRSHRMLAGRCRLRPSSPRCRATGGSGRSR